MKDLYTSLRTAYHTALNGNLSYGGSNVPVYDRVPNTATYPYVVYGQFSTTEIFASDVYIQDSTQELEVITGFDGNHGGNAMADSISNQIITIIRTRTEGYIDLSPNFKMISSTLDNSTSFVEDSVSHLIYRRLIRFRHKIEEL